MQSGNAAVVVMNAGVPKKMQHRQMIKSDASKDDSEVVQRAIDSAMNTNSRLLFEFDEIRHIQ